MKGKLICSLFFSISICLDILVASQRRLGSTCTHVRSMFSFFFFATELSQFIKRKMAAKSNRRTLSKEKGSNLICRTTQETLPDEIALRDEIFQLKRQLMVLKRTNQQNLVKFRKYEDEAKRKDRQIEQLMDPRKNGDIGKLLSTKGAAILMNLKDQNNSLVQIILNKDLQIRRLMAEIKTSKLYSASRKSELYRAEIMRLRNLLIKSHEMLKESIDLQNQRKSICFNENPLSETSSSDQSSPRDLEELRFTIQSLETHIKYSNELLSKKNQEILILTDKLNALHRTTLCKSCKNSGLKEPFDEAFQNGYLKQHEFVTMGPKYQTSFNFEDLTPKPMKISSGEELLELFEKTLSITSERKVPNSAPSSSLRCMTSSDSASKENSPLNNDNVQTSEDELAEESENLETHQEDSNESLVKCDQSINQPVPPKLQKSIFHELAASEILKEDKINSAKERLRKTGKGKERWKKALIKVKQINKSTLRNVECTQNRRKIDKENPRRREDVTDGGSDSGINEFEMMEGKIRDEEDVQSDSFHDIQHSPMNVDLKLDERKTNCENISFVVKLNEDTRGESKENKSNSSSNNSENEETPTNGITFSNASSPTGVKKDIYLVLTNNGSSQKLNKDEGTQNNEVDLTMKILEPSLNCETSNRAKEKEKECQNRNSTFSKSQIMDTHEGSEKSDTDVIKKEIHKMASTFSPEIQKELKNLYENISSYEEMEMKKVKTFREIHQQSFDSSLDSESGYPIKQEPQFVQVEVQINSVLTQSETSSQSGGSCSQNFTANGFFHENGECFEQDDNFNDDDDVIVR